MPALALVASTIILTVVFVPPLETGAVVIDGVHVGGVAPAGATGAGLVARVQLIFTSPLNPDGEFGEIVKVCGVNGSFAFV